MDKLTSILIVLGLFLVAREGFQQRDRIEPNKDYSKAWHIMGWFMRLLLVGAIYQCTLNWYYVVGMTFLLWVIYNISCNIGSKQKWFYLSDSGIDKILRKILFFVKF